ncbi:MAG: flagellar motor protein MotB [Nitrospinae bacterium]|nr:flagellar motor protein MotB [Nitrospinota bacterium]
MGISRQKKKDSGGEPEMDVTVWMVTFADLLSLLLTFFVLLYAMKTLDNQVLKEMFTAFSGGAGPLWFTDRFPMERMHRDYFVAPHTLSIKQFLEFLEEEGKQSSTAMAAINVKGIEEALLLSQGTIRKKGPKFSVTFPNRTMFGPSSATLTPTAMTALDRLADAMQYSQSKLVIEGHTDDLPVDTPRFPSNWELSAARAAEVMRYLTEVKGLDSRRILGAYGYADSRPVVGNISESYRARNRRVEIVVEQTPPEGA